MPPHSLSLSRDWRQGFLLAALLTFALVTLAVTPAGAARIGVLATLEGPFAPFGEDARRGIELAVDEFDGMAGGEDIELVFESTDGDQTTVVKKARKLIETNQVDVIIGPLSGGEGLALKEFAKTVPDKTFVNGAAAAQDMTLREPAENFFRFTTDSAQWMAGLGTYVSVEKGYEQIVTIAEDYSFPYTQIQGFMLEYCARGGHVIEKHWVPVGPKDYGPIIEHLLKTEADALFVGLEGAEAAKFLRAYWDAGGALPFIAGSVTLDPTLMNAGEDIRKKLVGTPSAGPLAGSDPADRWQIFVARYRLRYADASPVPSLFAYSYYVNTKAILLALDEVEGDLSNGQSRLRKALARLTFDTPTGQVALDEQHQAIANNYVTEVTQDDQGNLYNEVVYVATAVGQSLGLRRGAFLEMGAPGPDNPSCP